MEIDAMRLARWGLEDDLREFQPPQPGDEYYFDFARLLDDGGAAVDGSVVPASPTPEERLAASSSAHARKNRSSGDSGLGSPSLHVQMPTAGVVPTTSTEAEDGAGMISLDGAMATLGIGVFDPQAAPASAPATGQRATSSEPKLHVALLHRPGAPEPELMLDGC